ncbi:EthD domain-containing protein [Streptomyces sp. NBC_00582]|uniref:EthD domain-containing protein n=1 Tax=Streptomyces sp. NBC_00582 TaxID=2975783 RepID=UPI0010638C5F|nr:EthD domain-containing protein [Streptomyces sp. NBC_00582]WUB66039.1 EthD domain-containing protein [Streptomyces sp. NBC_00582]
MVKLVAVLRRRPDMTHAEYLDYIVNVHAKLAPPAPAPGSEAAVPAGPPPMGRYIQNHVFDSAYGATGDDGYQVTMPRDSVTELSFNDVESMRKVFESPFTRDVVGPDGANFSDLPAAVSLLVEETRTGRAAPSDTDVKVLHFLGAGEGLSAEEVQERWLRAHQDVLAADPELAAALRGHEWNTVIPGQGMTGYFGGAELPEYVAYSALWFDESEALPLFRRYAAGIAEHQDKHGTFYRPSLSFFLLCREVVIFDVAQFAAPSED